VKILFLARQPPVHLDNGSRIRTHALASQLAAVASVHLIAFDTQPGSPLAPESVQSVAAALPGVASVRLVPPHPPVKRRMQAETLFGRGSYLFRQHRSSALERVLAEAIATLEPDVLHCDNLLLGEFVRRAAPSVLRVIAPENVESVLMRRMSETTHALGRRLLYRREAVLLERWERAHMAEFDLCLAVSEDDARHFSALGARAHCIPNGVAAHAAPAPVAALAGEEPLRLLFVGSGSYQPNRVGVAWFLERVLPELSCRVAPELTLIGSGWDWVDDPRCRVAGHVASLEPYYASHHVALAPLRSGGGSRLKVAEALAKGIPLLGTSIGLEGYPLEDGVHALFGDTPAELALHLRWLDDALRSDTAPVDRQVQAGYQLITSFFWDEIGARLAGVYTDALARKRASESEHGGIEGVALSGRGRGPRDQARDAQRVLSP
jgi:glycosyltransferase involved in cell wall biosynthesis